MSSIILSPAATGAAQFTVAAPATATNRTLTLPDATTTLVGTDATQTLTNKSIDAGQLTGALPAIDGSALTGIGSVLLGTLTTTSGTTQTLSGLTLTGYKFLQIWYNGVSFATSTASALLTVNGFAVGDCSTANSFGAVVGSTEIELSTGAMFSVTNPANYASGVSSTITNSTTSLTFASSKSSGNFDAGSINVYGVK